MKYLFAQPAVKRFSWELRTAIKSLTDLGVKNDDIVILFSKHDDSVVAEFSDYDTHAYIDGRYDKEYIPSIRPYLWWRFLDEEPSRQEETYVYLDSDVVVLDLSVFKVPATNTCWYCSDTIGYIGYRYIKSVTNAQTALDVMTETIDVPEDWVESIEKGSGGAQWVIKNPKAEYWYNVYVNSIRLYTNLKPIDTSLQKWTAEMWAQLWTMYHYGVTPKVSKRMDFAWSTDDELENKKIIHNAGVSADSGMFFKGKYTDTPPLQVLYQESGKVSDIYVDFVREANY